MVSALVMFAQLWNVEMGLNHLRLSSPRRTEHHIAVPKHGACTVQTSGLHRREGPRSRWTSQTRWRSNPYGAMHSLSSTGATTARGRYLETCAEGERIVQKPYKATTEVHADDYDWQRQR